MIVRKNSHPRYVTAFGRENLSEGISPVTAKEQGHGRPLTHHPMYPSAIREFTLS